MNYLMIQDGGALTISDGDRIRIAAAWEAFICQFETILSGGVGPVRSIDHR